MYFSGDDLMGLITDSGFFEKRQTRTFCIKMLSVTSYLNPCKQLMLNNIS